MPPSAHLPRAREHARGTARVDRSDAPRADGEQPRLRVVHSPIAAAAAPAMHSPIAANSVMDSPIVVARVHEQQPDAVAALAVAATREAQRNLHRYSDIR